MRLTDLPRRRVARIVKFFGPSDTDEDSPVTSRLRALGIEENARVEILYAAPLGDPLVIRVDELELALRRREAETIAVDPGQAETAS